jgi:hypothetical protein
MSASPQQSVKRVAKDQSTPTDSDRLQSALRHKLVERRPREPIGLRGSVDTVRADVDVRSWFHFQGSPSKRAILRYIRPDVSSGH